ncbi:MAG: tRNA (adenosine(37)-N6)-threonylcarbamoyltransferase complex ATPase subunit type 1 TsaE [Burkholderiales bacterium PBB5]|nr:MAG: tRNA (adenosine(37)-N6)-threonylcarbamoyltransferase complex ATPase subunit type 1 TsaE [Burkholderiales bacterium PBB5]
MVAGGQPGQQAGLGRAQVHIGHPDLGESQLSRPVLQLLPQPRQRRLVQRRACPGHRQCRCPFTVNLRSALNHPAILASRTLHWPDEAACAAWATALATKPALADALIELHGPLGAGKTTFVRHLLRALGVTGRIKSPTYTVMEPYALPGGGEVAHFDFYRFTDPREWLDAGFRDVFARPGLKIAEWPDKAADLLPTPDLQLHIAPGDDDQRLLSVHAFTPRGVELLD